MKRIATLLTAILFFGFQFDTYAQAPAMQWDARFGGSSNDELYHIQQTNDGGYILGGRSLSCISGDKTQASQGDYDYWVVKTDVGGMKQWDARFGGYGFIETHKAK